MGKKELLQRYIDQESHNLLCYSANYLMTKPKPGYENEFTETNQRLALLDEIQKDLEQSAGEKVITAIVPTNQQPKNQNKTGVMVNIERMNSDASNHNLQAAIRRHGVPKKVYFDNPDKQVGQ